MNNKGGSDDEEGEEEEDEDLDDEEELEDEDNMDEESDVPLDAIYKTYDPVSSCTYYLYHLIVLFLRCGDTIFLLIPMPIILCLCLPMNIQNFVPMLTCTMLPFFRSKENVNQYYYCVFNF